MNMPQKRFAAFIALMTALCASCEMQNIYHTLSETSEVTQTHTEAATTSAAVTTAVFSTTEQTTVTETTTSLPETSVSEETTFPLITEYIVDHTKSIGRLGTAAEIAGTTVIISVFADDMHTSWSDSDGELMLENLYRLDSAGKWLSAQCLSYGTESRFVCDWTEDNDLWYRARFGDDLVRSDAKMYDVQRAFIENEIKSDELKSRYDADNIIYVFFFNTTYDNNISPWSVSTGVSPLFDVEFINSYVKFKGFDIPSASYAHELLHCFGAHDLYIASEEIPQPYVDHCEKTGSNDIMYRVNEGEINVELSELDAYYVGLTDECEQVKQWHLAESEH